MKSAWLVTPLLAAVVALAGCAQDTGGSRAPAAGGGPPVLDRHANGSITVRYDNGCVVTYNREGRRSGSNGCRPGQVERADAAVQEDAAARGAGGLKFRKLRNGSARVTFDDGCVVTYNRDGRRSGSQGCHPRQVARADEAAQARW